MTSVPQEAKELISESLLLTILSRFLECIPDLACILDANGKIMCHNQQFGCVILQPDAKTECSKDDQPVSNNDSSDSIYSHFNCKSFDVLREGIVAAVNEKKISYHISLTHKYNSASTMSWSVKAIDSVGINDMVLMMGYEKKRTSISQCLAQLGGFNGKITPTSPSRPYIRSPVIRDDVIYVLRRQSTNKELGKESELVEYGEEQMRRRLITASRRSSNTTLRNLISERDQLHDIMGKKQTFVRSIAHEIRTPLNVVIAGLLILDLEFPENHPNVLVRQTLDTMKISSQDAIDTIGDFITYEKMSSNILKPDKATRNFYGTVAKCIRPFYLQAQTLQIDLLYSNEDKMGPCPVEIDEYKINQVIRNLVSNAIKFSPPYSEVRISVKKVHSAEKGERIRLEVMDSGPGISEANQKKLFNEIVQFNPGELQGGGGSGLGLWISKRIVDMHDGTIGIDSAGEGFGSTFFVELPTIFGHLANKTELTDSETDSLIEVSALGTTQCNIFRSFCTFFTCISQIRRQILLPAFEATDSRRCHIGAQNDTSAT